MESTERVWRERGLREAVLAGDELAWRRWYDESCEPLYAYLLWRSGGLRDCADELAQEVWMLAVRKLPSFDPVKGSFLSWLRGLGAGLARNHFRRESRRRAAPLPESLAADDGGPGRREEAESVAVALAALPERYESVLRAKYLDGASVAEIAAVRGESAKAVESLLTRAREAFRTAYLSTE
jgi:RNA polymerase sigma-70 factor (ECF subfamily)